MCDPVSMTILAVTTTAASIYSANKLADNQEAAIREQLESLEDESRKTESAETNDRLRAMRKEQARTKVAAGEAGLQLGGSIEALLKDSLMQTSLAGERIGLNNERDRRAGRAEANSMLSNIQKDTALGAGLKLASAGSSAWNTGQSIKIARAGAGQSAGRK